MNALHTELIYIIDQVLFQQCSNPCSSNTFCLCHVSPDTDKDVEAFESLNSLLISDASKAIVELLYRENVIARKKGNGGTDEKT